MTIWFLKNLSKLCFIVELAAVYGLTKLESSNGILVLLRFVDLVESISSLILRLRACESNFWVIDKKLVSTAIGYVMSLIFQKINKFEN